MESIKQFFLLSLKLNRSIDYRDNDLRLTGDERMSVNA